MEGLGESLVPNRVSAIPGLHLCRGPVRFAIRMAARAGIGHAEGDRLIRSWHSKAVVVARVDQHVAGGRHVAPGARGTLPAGAMEMMRVGVVLGRRVAWRTDLVARRAELL